VRLCFVFSSGGISLCDYEEAPPIIELSEEVEDEHGNVYATEGRRVLERLTLIGHVDPVNGIIMYEEICGRRTVNAR
jgi:hypothetical protein